MSSVRKYLIIRADRSARVVTRVPSLDSDEVAIPLVFKFPDNWGHTMRDPIEIDVPDFAPQVEVEPQEEES